MASGPGKAFSVSVTWNKICCYSAATVSAKVREESPKSTIISCLVQAFCCRWLCVKAKAPIDTDWILFVVFCEGQCLHPPRCRQHYTSSKHRSERPVQTLVTKLSTTCGKRFNVGLILLDRLLALTLTFINDKLLFIFFQLVFQLLRIL
jgi:hypothetical protein